jgi:hypothetical protein
MTILINRIVSPYRQKIPRAILIAVSVIWIFSALLSWFYQLSTYNLCNARLFITCVTGFAYWTLLTPIIISETKQAATRYALPRQLFFHSFTCMVLVAINQVVIFKSIGAAFEWFWGCNEMGGYGENWIFNIIHNNVLSNSMIYWLIAGITLLRERPATMSPVSSNETVATAEPVAAAPIPFAYPDTIMLKTNQGTEWVGIGNIHYIQADQNCIHIHTAAKKYVMYSSLTRFSLSLNPEVFARIHRSCVVNKRVIQTMNNNTSGDAEVILTSGTVLKCSRNYKKQLV